ncbi:transcription termination factor MTERF8, chloroplastic [Abrus precatorius]|uniref:Transcription termination factor MTERF8, chloroplastic n=1 Tax=Abrus precatorius TaxID=3816 RepID=A0A8B8M3K0_ABRPR|nr:transcription termination factor MTERF8, chloroplastic [Abrus precatorius]
MLLLHLSPNRSSLCSSITFHPFPLNLSHSFQLSLQPQPFFSLTTKQQSNNHFFRRRCTNSVATLNTQIASFISLFQQIGIGFVETQTLFTNNPDLTSLPLDSLRTRLLSLHSLGFDRVTLYQLVTKRPTVLTDKEIDPLLTFLRDELQGEIEKEQLNRLFFATEPRFLVGFPQKVQLLIDRGVPVYKVVHVLNKVNLQKALCYRAVDEIDKIIAFLEPFSGISLILKRPAVLNFDLESQLVPRVNVLTELSGGDDDSVGKVLLRFPAFLNYSVEHVEEHVEFLRSFVDLGDQEIFRIILGFPAIVTASRERKLRPRIQFLKDCGLDSGDIFKFLIKAPLFLSHSFYGNIVHKLVLLVKIGYRYRTRDLAMAMRSATRTNCENLRKVIGLFLSYGLTCEDIVAMAKKHPQILQYNNASLEKKMKYLIEEMERDIEELLVFPAFLGYKFDDRIKHRFEVKKSTRGGGMSINKLLTVSNERFTGK